MFEVIEALSSYDGQENGLTQNLQRYEVVLRT